MTTANRRGLVIVPAFNEGGSINEVTRALVAGLPDWDILVVDDGSVDSTATFMPHEARIIHNPFNLGIGGAVQAGYRYAAIRGYDYAVQVDGDGQHPPEAVPALLRRMFESGADMVIGSRFLQPGLYSQTVVRSIGTWVVRTLLRALTGRQFADCASGFRLVNRRLIRAFSYWYPDDYPEPEVLLHLHRAGCRMEELAVRMHQRTSGRSSISLGMGILYVAKVSVSLVLALFRRPWPGDLLQPRDGQPSTRPTVTST